MAGNVTELLQAHLDGLLAAETDLRAQLGSLAAEIVNTRRALDAAWGKIPPSNGYRDRVVTPDHADPSILRMTIKQLVDHALTTEYRGGATARELLDLFERWGRGDVVRTSLSPQLSRMKEENRIVLEGTRWRKRMPASIEMMSNPLSSLL